MEDQTIMTEFGAIRPNRKNPRTITAEAMARLCESIAAHIRREILRK